MQFSRCYDYQHALNEDLKALHKWFNTIQHVINENGILPEDIYNFDETGFAMGLIVMTSDCTRESKWLLRVKTIGNGYTTA